MIVYFIIISFQTIGGAGQISTANGGTIPINDIRGTLLAKVNQSKKQVYPILKIPDPEVNIVSVMIPVPVA